MRARVGQVLALEVDAAADPLGEAVGAIERSRPPDEVAQQALELGPECPRRRAPRPRRPKARRAPPSTPRGRSVRRSRRSGSRGLRSRRCLCLRRPRLARPPRARPRASRPPPRAQRCPSPSTRRSARARGAAAAPDGPPASSAAAAKAVISSWSLIPGADSTPLATSTAHGRVRSIASPTFSAVRPPARIKGTFERRRRRSSQSIVWPVPAGHPLAVGVEEVEVDAEGTRKVDVRRAPDPDRLDDRAAGPPSDLVAERKALVAVELHHREVLVLDRPGDLVNRLIDEDANDLELAPKSRADLGRDRVVAAPDASLPVIEADRPRAEARRVLGVVVPRYAAELDPHRGSRMPRAPDRTRARKSGRASVRLRSILSAAGLSPGTRSRAPWRCPCPCPRSPTWSERRQSWHGRSRLTSRPGPARTGCRCRRTPGGSTGHTGLRRCHRRWRLPPAVLMSSAPLNRPPAGIPTLMNAS